jgi:hypothetical protein
MSGFDIIGDVHGEGEKLVGLLDHLANSKRPHSVQRQSFSNAFSNAGSYVRSRPNTTGFKAQYCSRIRAPADAFELQSTA